MKLMLHSSTEEGAKLAKKLKNQFEGAITRDYSVLGHSILKIGTLTAFRLATQVAFLLFLAVRAMEVSQAAQMEHQGKC